MKELSKKTKDKIENVKQVSIEKKTVFLGTAHSKKGHTMFEVNDKLKTIVKAQYEIPKTLIILDEQVNKSRRINLFGRIVTLPRVTTKKLIKKPDCHYVSALNKKNALKVLKREIGFDINNKN